MTTGVAPMTLFKISIVGGLFGCTVWAWVFHFFIGWKDAIFIWGMMYIIVVGAAAVAAFERLRLDDKLDELDRIAKEWSK